MSGTQIFTRSYCGRQLRWHIVGNGFDHPNAAPDVVFDDASFSPLTTERHNGDLVALMDGWQAEKTSLLEYVPHLADRIEQHLHDHCPAALLRFELINSLSKLLGPPLEVNMMAKSGSSVGPSSSSTAGSHSSGGGPSSMSTGGGSGAPKRVQCEQQPLLLQLELSQAFPGDPPVLLLQNTRRMGPDSCVTLRDMPWSPRWPVDEMIARLFNFLKQEAAGFLAKDQLG
eukprot:gene6578-6806_t